MIKQHLQEVWQRLRGPLRYVRKTEALLESGDLEAAAALIRKARKRFGQFASVHVLFARIHMLLDRPEEVRQSLELVAENPRAKFDFVLEAAEIYQALGEDRRAIEILESLGKRFESWEGGLAYNRAGNIYYRLGQIGESLSQFVDAVSRGGRVSWASLNEVIDEATDDQVRACQEKMHLRLQESDRNAYFFKFLSLLDSRLGDREAMVEHIRTGARKRFRSCYPDVPWIDSNDPLRPSFLVMGAMKSGTTSLFEQLENHPLCLTAMDKELQFFQHKNLDETWYLEHFPRVSEFPGFVCGDASPGYYAFDVVDRVKKLLPEVKLIFIQRDPAKRAISHFRHNSRYGITEGGLEAVLWEVDELEQEMAEAPEKAEQLVLDICSGARVSNVFLAMGCYKLLLRRWRDAFPASQLLTLELEDFKVNPQMEMNRVFDFLGLEPVEVTMKKANEGGYITSDSETEMVAERLERFYETVSQIS